MSKIFNEIMQGLKEAIAIAEGNIPLEQKEDMPAPTFVPAEHLEEIE